MRVLIIGLGSMGKRRIRNLQALGYRDIFGYDPRKDRCIEANDKYFINCYQNFERAVVKINPEVFIISTPPDLHMEYAYYAYEKSINCFIEASVVDDEKILKLSQMMEDKNFLIVPSCTMDYLPFVIKIRELIKLNRIGTVLNINYQVGQYLPDWHPWEDIKDFYVSKKETGAGREIVPFELTWLNNLFGNPKALACIKTKLTNLDADIDDIYHFILKYPNNLLANITVEVISRPKATRELIILGSKGKISYTQDTNILKYTNIDMDDWEIIKFDLKNVEKDYIYSEEPYIQEIDDFMKSIKLKKDNKEVVYNNTLKKDYLVLQILYKLEELANKVEK